MCIKSMVAKIYQAKPTSECLTSSGEKVLMSTVSILTSHFSASERTVSRGSSQMEKLCSVAKSCP